MTELDRVWSKMLEDAGTRSSGDVAEYLRLKASNDAIRTAGVGWLFDTMIETAGDAMGGITLVPTDVVADGDAATVTYDVMFGDTAAYTALTGTIPLVDGTWVVSRAEFCGFMASARNACPA